ncbi:MAG: Flp pilus assembly protein CpaB [Candidatus Flexifilum sp.]|jgi:pilus assembly protein CpaB
MNRLRVFLILAIIIVLIAVVIVVVLPSLNPAPAPVAQQPADTSASSLADLAQAMQAMATPLPTPTPINFVDIVIAVQELQRGQVIPPDAVALRPFPEQSVPFNGIRSLEDVIGRIARTDIYREEPILSNMVVDNLTDLARVGSDAAAVLPVGLVAVALPIDRLTSVAYAVQPGDRVDLIISLLFVDIDEDFQTIVPNEVTLFRITEDGEINFLQGISGRPDSTSLGSVIIGPSERQRPRLVTQRTIQDALVVNVGNFPPDGRFIGVPPTPTPVPAEGDEGQTGQGTPPPPTPTPARPDIITLGVTPQDAVILTWLIEARIPVTLALRSAQDTSRVPTNEVTLDYIMTEFGIELPGKRPYTIEPAIRSIRQLLAGQEIALSEAVAP